MSALLARLFAFALVLTLAPLGVAQASGADPKDLVAARLVPEVTTLAPGQPFWVALALRMKPGWHVYWKNPGDSGLPVQLDWRLAADFAVGEPQWPAPSLFVDGPVASYGYAEEALLLVEVTPPAGLSVGDEVPLDLRASWLVCEEECLPGEARLEAALAVGERPLLDEGARALFARARAALPQAAPFAASLSHRPAGAEPALLLEVQGPGLDAGAVRRAHFFPDEGKAVDHAAAQLLSRIGVGLTLALLPSPLAPALPRRLSGVLTIEREVAGGTVRQAYPLRAALPEDAALGRSLPPPPIPPEAAATAQTGTVQAGAVQAGAAIPAQDEAPLGLLEVLLFALLGGLILNLMPCVFPVLSLKVLGIVEQAGEDAGRIRLHGFSYTGGVLLSFAALAGALILLRAGGAEIGWGFQLQSPWFVALLAYVMLAMALSLSGLFELGHSVMGLGSGLAAKKGLSGSFFTGVLATVVATPCTAPFMGAAVGFALSQPWIIALGVFLALGFGLALPFLVLSFAPALMRRLPRPGPWMVTLKEGLAFPLYGTVAWLVWVLEQQAGPLGLGAALAGLVLVAFAAWAYGRSRPSEGAPRLAGTLATLAGAAGALALLPSLVDLGPAAVARAEPGSPVAAAGGFAPYSQERLEGLLGEGKPVFINLTAAWCVTCLVNEKNALSTDGVKRALTERGITYLKGDWTHEDPEITRLLERFGRSGVPLYLYYAKGQREPVILPQILTEDIVLEYLGAG